LAGAPLVTAVYADLAAMADAHAAIGAGDLLIVIAAEPAQAYRVQHAEHGFSWGGDNRFFVDVYGQCLALQGLDVMIAV
jgi:hypothetical protein